MIDSAMGRSLKNSRWTDCGLPVVMVKTYQGLQIVFNTSNEWGVIVGIVLNGSKLCRVAALLLICSICPRAGAADPVSFSREVLPILSDKCFSCHGPDESHRKADLRLDQRAEAIKADAIVPGKAEQSELLARVLSRDADELMPPAESHKKPLSSVQAATLRRWIDEGAQWGKHWSFEEPVRAKLPGGIHPVDFFVRSKLKEQGLNPAPPADRHTQLRRVSFGITGLPPSAAEMAAYRKEKSVDAWDRQIDRLLASNHFGERMAMWWLDAARYADTDGYQGDRTRENWPWRDWVIDSFNGNMPFDQFTIEQFAGDLLPDSTPEQKLATCFHRNHMTNGEGGRDPEESRIDYVIDRVNTMGTVWLGLTLGCTQCHSHKFDPISHRDYYSLFAYFNNIDETGGAGTGAKPALKYKSPYAARTFKEAEEYQRRLKPLLDGERVAAETRFDAWLERRVEAVSKGFTPWHVLNAAKLHSVEGTTLKQDSEGVVAASGLSPFQDDYHFRAGADLSRITGFRLEVFPHESHADGKLSRGASGNFILTDVKLMVQRKGRSEVRDVEFSTAIADVEKKAKGRAYGNIRDTLDDDPRNGWTLAEEELKKAHTGVFALAAPLELAEGEELIFVMLHRSTTGDANIGRFRVSVTDQAGAAVKSLKPMAMTQLAALQTNSAGAVEGDLRKALFEQFLEDDREWLRKKAAYDAATAQVSEFKKAMNDQRVMILGERKAVRDSHILVRGVWDAKGEMVAPGVLPAVLPWPVDKSGTRLELAKWLVAENNPLTARVIANHMWSLLFGAGLVRTPDDFGLQGEQPTHPGLLDWLARELMDNGWDLKHLLKVIATSETYRQSGVASAGLRERDPENRLLARAPRFRLSSWMLRDAALKAAGLLNPALGGPPIRPYQPPGIWKEIFMGRFNYKPSVGPAQYRRTVYAFWRRSSAPTFLFDSAQRRVCEVNTRRTNTPLQALTLMNDLSMLEASRQIAANVWEEHTKDSARINALFNTILSRSPSKSERAVALRELKRARAHYHNEPEDALRFVERGQTLLANFDNLTELAAGMLVSSMILNLDEALTHE
jgi:hypothetical protein